MKRSISVFLLFFAAAACAQGHPAEQPNISSSATNNHDSSQGIKSGNTDEPEDDEFGCLAGVTNKLILVFFPVQDKSQFSWTWNAKDNGSPAVDPLDYSWIAEPGRVDKKGDFVPARYAVGFAHRNYGYWEKETTGPLEALVNDRSTGHATIYLNDTDRNKRTTADVFEQLDEVRMDKLFAKNGVWLSSLDPQAKTLLLSGAATHMRLTVKTPYPSQSYSCITTINYTE